MAYPADFMTYPESKPSSLFRVRLSNFGGSELQAELAFWGLGIWPRVWGLPLGRYREKIGLSQRRRS